jgi:hypothetical protein
MNAISRWFLDHPESRDETYLEHQGVAASYGWALMLAGLACLVHAVFPALCTTTGSQAVRRIHARMTGRLDAPTATSPVPSYVLLMGDGI